MKKQNTGKNRHYKLRALALSHIALVTPFVEGSLCKVKRPGCAKPGWQLTFKKQGKTCTVYVPMDLAVEVQAWADEYKRLRKLMRNVTTHSLGLIRGHVANRAAASRGRASIPKRAPKRSLRS